MPHNTILITGGAGYIGSHTTLEFLQTGFDVVVIDDLSNGSAVALERVEQLADKKLSFIEGDINDSQLLDQIFTDYNIAMVVHFAAFKAVGESAEKPLDYFYNNVSGSINLLRAMDRNDVRKLVFSSSATVYGEPDSVPISEDAPLKDATNPYGQTKKMIEIILNDLFVCDKRWSIASLRYFNPAGAHPSGEIGEDPKDIPNNLVPYITQVAIGKREYLSVFGDDYSTDDGTGVRDYIHIMDLADGHLAAAEYLLSNPAGIYTWNLGTGIGYSVLQLVSEFEKASTVQIPYKITARRSGDIAAMWSDPSRAKRDLNWQAKYTLSDMMRDAWRWQQKNPNGY